MRFVRLRGLALVFATFLLAPAAGCGPAGADGDGDGADASVPAPDDADGDSISDADEGRAQNVDTDGDGTPDYLDDDADGDGVPDYREAGDGDPTTRPVDSDSDGKPDFRDTDSDDNGRPDGVDGTDDLDADGVPNFADLDDDGDGMTDANEIGPNPDAPFDTDGDGLADFQDVDSDNDTILDKDELGADPDGDGVPAFRDTDSDDDCRVDAFEAGDANLMTKPVDTDADTRADFLDLDSDNDGLPDRDEDVNCNGLADPGESSPTSADTDGDGVTDLVEVAAGTNPTDANDNPQANGDFVFTVPYQAPPDPTDDTLDFSTNIVQADVAFVMDTTGSMGGEINNLKSSLGTIVSTLAMDIPNVAFAVSGYDDFADSTGCYGSAAWGDAPFYLLHRVMTTKTAAGLASVQNAVNAFTTHGGNDGPESGWEAMHQVATGAGISYGGVTVPMFNPATAPPASIPAGEEVGAIGGVGFRSGSFPVVVWITDAHNHNSEAFPGDYYGAGGCAAVPGAAFRSNATAELMAIGARVIAVVSNDWDYANAKADATYAVSATGSLVPPSAWGTPGIDRPPGCAVTQCCTGQGGAGEATDGSGMCPLTFTVASNGSGLGTSIIQAIKKLTTYATIDIGAAIADSDASDGVDAVQAFVQRLEANPTAGAPCASGLSASDTNGDGVLDTFGDVNPGTTVCFDVVPKMNTTVPATDKPQMFRATITVTGDGITTLDTRDVYFLVPPVIPEPPIM